MDVLGVSIKGRDTPSRRVSLEEEPSLQNFHCSLSPGRAGISPLTHVLNDENKDVNGKC